MVDGHKRTAPIRPMHGVKQGCPLSPLLFSLYINDVAERFRNVARDGVQLRSGVQVSMMLYADDLCLVSNTKSGLQRMLNVLSSYSREKQLEVNTDKSQIMVFNTRQLDFAFDYTDISNGRVHRLAVVGEFKYLGVLFNQWGSMRVAADSLRSRMYAKVRDINKMGRQHGVSKDIYCMKGLFQTFALSAGMYACQVWGTAYLAPDATFMSPIEKIRLVFAKRILRVHKGCANMAVYAELGWHTYQYYYLRCMARFWNDLCDCNSSILRATMESDITLAIDGGSTACWTYGFSQALERLQPSFADDIKARRKLCVTTITRLLLDARNTYWNRLWAVNPRVNVLPDLDIKGGGRMHVIYAKWFKCRDYTLPHYISQGQLVVRRSMIDSMAKFRLGNHNLHIAVGRRAGPNRKPYSQRLCNRCHNSVDDELHMVFECPVFECVRTHSYFTELFVNTAEHKDMESFIHHTSVRKVAFFIDICLRAIDSQDLNRYITDALRHFHFVGQAARRLAVPM